MPPAPPSHPTLKLSSAETVVPVAGITASRAAASRGVCSVLRSDKTTYLMPYASSASMEVAVAAARSLQSRRPRSRPRSCGRRKAQALPGHSSACGAAERSPRLLRAVVPSPFASL
jgi:hypothetical protein